MRITIALATLLVPSSSLRLAAPRMLFDFFGAKSPEQTAGVNESEEAMRARYLEAGVQIPRYEVLREGDGWEVRRYQPLAVAECDYDKRPEGYELLGGYAGGENEFGISMPRTAPCVMQPSREPEAKTCGSAGRGERGRRAAQPLSVLAPDSGRERPRSHDKIASS